MPQKRKAESPDSVYDNPEDAHESPALTSSQVSDIPTRRSKRHRPNPNYKEPSGLYDESGVHSDEEQKSVPNPKQVVATAGTKTETKESNPTDSVIPKKTRGTSTTKSRGRERKRTEPADMKNEKLGSNVNELLLKSKRQAERIEELEILQLAASGRSKAYFQDDQTIRGNVKLLFDMINKWAFNWAHGGEMMSHMTDEQVAATNMMLQGHSEHLENRVLCEKAVMKCVWITAGCRLATEAFLANKIAKMFLTRPFNIRMQSKSGKQTNMEEHVESLRGIMKSSQVETNLWSSVTLRTQYSPDQYADSIVKPIIDDHLEEARKDMYSSVISEWMLQKGSPLSPLLVPCEEPKLERRTANMKKILHAASKLSLQLWVQDAEVEVIDDILSQESGLRLFDSRSASLHSLMPESMEAAQLRDREIDLLVRPRIRMTKFDPAQPDRRRSILTKATIVICSEEDCHANREEFDNINLLPPSLPVLQSLAEQVLTDQDSRDARNGVSEERLESPQTSPVLRAKVPAVNLQRLTPGLNDTAARTETKELDSDKLSADAQKSTSNHHEASEPTTRESRYPEKHIVDLTDETRDNQAEEISQEPTNAIESELSHRKVSSDTAPSTKFILPGFDQATSMLPHFYPSVSEWDRRPDTKPADAIKEREEAPEEKSQGKNEKETEASPNRVNEGSRDARDGPRFGGERKASIAGSYHSQFHNQGTENISSCRILGADSEVRDHEKSHWPSVDEQGERIHDDMERGELLTRKMAQIKDDVDLHLEGMRSLIGTNDNDETIEVADLQAQPTPIEKSHDEASHDREADSQHPNDTNNEARTEDIGGGEGQNDI